MKLFVERLSFSLNQSWGFLLGPPSTSSAVSNAALLNASQHSEMLVLFPSSAMVSSIFTSNSSPTSSLRSLCTLSFLGGLVPVFIHLFLNGERLIHRTAEPPNSKSPNGKLPNGLSGGLSVPSSMCIPSLSTPCYNQVAQSAPLITLLFSMYVLVEGNPQGIRYFKC